MGSILKSLNSLFPEHQLNYFIITFLSSFLGVPVNDLFPLPERYFFFQSSDVRANMGSMALR